MDDNLKKILNTLEAQCSRREYCISDIRRKLKEKFSVCGAAADELIDSLVSDGFVDEGRYAAAFARDKASIALWGPVKIRFHLRAKGIEDSVISDAVAQIDGTKAAPGMEKLLLSKWKSLKDDPQGRLKLIKFALSRGYEYESVQNFLRNLTLSSPSLKETDPSEENPSSI